MKISCVDGPESDKLILLARYHMCIVLEQNVNTGATMLQHATEGKQKLLLEVHAHMQRA